MATAEQVRILKAHIPPFGMFGMPRRNTETNTRYKHTGIDIYGPIGTPIIAAEKGRIFSIYKDIESPRAGNLINLSGDVYYLRYLHLEAVKVDKGAHVEAGETIGTLGISGNAKYARKWIVKGVEQGRSHLHFEARDRNNTESIFDPLLLVEQGKILVPVDISLF